LENNNFVNKLNIKIQELEANNSEIGSKNAVLMEKIEKCTQ
jgi:hypothetical protein